MKCKCCDDKVIEEIEKKYGISIYKIQYLSLECETTVEQGKIVKKGMGFKKWAKNYKQNYKQDSNET